MQDAEAAVAAKPSWIKGYTRLGAAQTAAGLHAEATATYRRALRLDPLNTSLSVALGQAMVAAKAAPAGSPAAGEGGEGAGEEEEEGDADALGAFFGEVEALAKSSARAKRAAKQEFVPGPADAEVARLTGEHSMWRNLNPLFVLGLPVDHEEEDIKRHYRKLSAVVHPDKCKLEAATAAFEAVKAAYAVLQDPERRAAVLDIHREAEEEAKRTLKRMRKRGTPDSDMPSEAEEVQREVQRRFAEIERKKRKFEKRLASKAARDAEEESTAKEVEAEVKAEEAVWEEKRLNRFSNWQGFKGAKKRRLGGIKNDSIRYGVKAAEAAKADTVSAADEKVFKSKWR